MIPSELLKRIRSIEIKTRAVVDSTLSGGYHSAFKGQGLDFAEVREYTPGDDVRQIDWKVTARAGIPHIKLFNEERELTVILLVDLSASGNFGSSAVAKSEVAAEIAAVLGFSAINNQDRVGLILFSDQIEKFIPAKKGKDHVFRILRDIFYYKNKSKKTSISTALDYVLKVTKKKAIVFLISDFLDTDYEKSMRVVSKKHDFIPVIIEDPRESSFPKGGLIRLQDEETGEQIIVNTRSKEACEKLENIMLARQLERDRFFKSLNLKPIKISAGESYVQALIRFFQTRSGRK